EEPEPDADDDRERRLRPVRDPRRVEDIDDEPGCRDDVEEAVREDRSDDRRPGSGTAPQMPRHDRDAGELPYPARQGDVPEKTDAERREDDAPRRPRLRNRLEDDHPPRGRAHHDRHEVDADRDGHPAPGDRLERVREELRVRSMPDDEDDRDPDQDAEQHETARTALRQSPHQAAARSGSAPTASSS